MYEEKNRRIGEIEFDEKKGIHDRRVEKSVTPCHIVSPSSNKPKPVTLWKNKQGRI
jgi:hypothetical protein